MKAMAIIGIVISVVFIIGMLATMMENENTEVNAGMVLVWAASFYWLAFSIVALVSLSKKKKTGTD